MRWCMTFWLRKAKLIQICRRALLASPFLTSLSQVGIIGACILALYASRPQQLAPCAGCHAHHELFAAALYGGSKLPMLQAYSW